jgi:ABC-2 type transport system ATP-binding protein
MITVHRLTKSYRTGRAVDDVTFEVRPGRVTGFLGPNGAGKSSTIRMILGLDTPTSGHVLINGTPFQALEWPLREVGALLDATAIHGGRSARHHLRWLAQAGGVAPSRVGEVLDRTGLAEVRDRRVKSFSLGMKQRLGIAAALLGDPGVLIFDEPVNGLDPDGVHWARRLFRSLAAEGRTVLVSSHLMSEMQLTADHVLVLARGRLLADCALADLVRSRAGGDVLVRTAHQAVLVPLLSARGAAVTSHDADSLVVTGLAPTDIADIAAAHGVALSELTPRRASLEDVFRELTEAHLQYRADARQENAR